jgi:hypothetical protein
MDPVATGFRGFGTAACLPATALNQSAELIVSLVAGPSCSPSAIIFPLGAFFARSFLKEIPI